jgi:hypothetical protein
LHDCEISDGNRRGLDRAGAQITTGLDRTGFARKPMYETAPITNKDRASDG